MPSKYDNMLFIVATTFNIAAMIFIAAFLWG
jgi:hypothetical protein